MIFICFYFVLSSGLIGLPFRSLNRAKIKCKLEQGGGGGSDGEWDDWCGAENADLDPDWGSDNENDDDEITMHSSSLLSAMSAMLPTSLLGQNKSSVVSMGEKNLKANVSEDISVKSVATIMSATPEPKDGEAIAKWENFYDFDKAETSFFEGKSNGMTPEADEKEREGNANVDNEDDWVENAPYFDEDDVVDDEGNWGRSDTDVDMAALRKSSPFINKEGGGLGCYSIWDKSYDPATGESWSSQYQKKGDQPAAMSSPSRVEVPSSSRAALSSSRPSRIFQKGCGEEILTSLVKKLAELSKKLESEDDIQEVKALAEAIESLSNAMINVNKII